MEAGIENVVQIIIDNAIAYVAVGRESSKRNIGYFFGRLVQHFIDLLLEDIGKLDGVTFIVDDIRSITKFIYNHLWVLHFIRDHTKGKELVRLGITRFTTILLTLQNILGSLMALNRMVVSQAWIDSSYLKKLEVERVAFIVFDNFFAHRATKIVKVLEPLVRVLCLVDGDQIPMGYLYEAMDRSKESIKNYYKGGPPQI